MFNYDTPVMKVYLAGLMSGEKLKETVSWRVQIREHYSNWKNSGKPYPILFEDPYSGPELESIDPKGYTSNIPARAIIMGDYMSVKNADIIVANLNSFGGSREPLGTQWELAWCWQLQKPFIIISEDEKYSRHPFTAQACIFCKSVEELINQKWLNYFYKRIAGANYSFIDRDAK